MKVILGGDRRSGCPVTVGSEMIGPLWPEPTSQQRISHSSAIGGVQSRESVDERARGDQSLRRGVNREPM